MSERADPRDTESILNPDAPRVWTAGRPATQRVGVSLNARLWSKITVGAPNDCWIWTGDTNPDGYGRIGVDGQHVSVHRLIYRLFHSRWPAESLHSCDTPRCVNPCHVREGTHAENIADMYERGRNWQSKVTQCPAGHPYEGANLHTRTTGARVCRTCNRDRNQTRREAQRVSP